MSNQDLALIIVDPQYDFCEDGGSLPIKQSNAIFQYINKLKKDINFGAVFITKDYHPEKHVSFASSHGLNPYTSIDIEGKKQELWPDHCIQGTHGQKIHQLLELNGQQILVHKGMLQAEDSYSGFGTEHNPSTLRQELIKKGIKRVFVVGLAYDFCVGSTALDANRFGFKTYIIKDGTRSALKQTEEIMKKRLEQAKISQITLKQAFTISNEIENKS